VVVGQEKHHQVGKGAPGFKLAEFADELGGAQDVGDLEVPADGVGVAMGTEGGDGGAAAKLNAAFAGLVLAPEIAPGDTLLAFGVFPAGLGKHPFAVIAKAFAVRQRVIPQETGRGPGQRIGAILAFAAGITAGSVGGDLTFHVFVGDGAVGPLVAVGALDPGAVGVVQQDKLPGDPVLVGRELFAEDAEAGVTVAFGHVAENLVVGAVFLDDVDDVLEHAGLAHALGNGPRGLVRARREQRFGEPWVTDVAQGGLGLHGELAPGGDGNERKRAEKVFGVEFGGFAGSEAFGRADAAHVGDAEAPPPGIELKGGGEPADRDQAKDFRGILGGGEFDDRHGVLGAVADVEPVSGRVESQGGGLGSEKVGGRLARPDFLHHPVRAGFDDTQRIAAGVGGDEKPAVG